MDCLFFGLIQPNIHSQFKIMKHLNSNRIIGLGCAILLVASVAGTLAQVKQGKTRPMQTKHWMKGVLKPHCNALKKGLDAGPSDADAWNELAMHAGLVSETSYILMEDGRCPDDVWANAASKTLREGSAAAIKAIEAKDLVAAKAAFKSLSKACSACHKKHKPKKK